MANVRRSSTGTKEQGNQASVPLTLAAGFGLGAAALYVLDPDRGRRRRHLLYDQTIKAAHRAGRAADGATKDLRNQATGMAARAARSVAPAKCPDDVLEARVRSKLGRLSFHAGAIDVTCRDGVVTLSGPILFDEMAPVVAGVSSIRGVRQVRNELSPRSSTEGIPDLQGGPSERQMSRARFGRGRWSPSARVSTGLAGSGLALFGINRGGMLGSVATIGGLTLAMRSLTAAPLSQITGIGAGRRAVMVRKHLDVNAPLEVVFDFWSNFENFPLFMDHVLLVRHNENGHSHWKVRGPAGATVGFTTETTNWIDGQKIAWKTLPGSAIQHSGIVNFKPKASGTCIDLMMSYNPVFGIIGHSVAWAFGVSPKQSMDDDLVRFKSLIEQGKTTAHHVKVTQENLTHQNQHQLQATSPGPVEETQRQQA